ncbi:hypothetical protein [Streptomyces tritici]|uniref:hypothetical protein n=1 Tax=Streptomyces tritici TaxID=2054410 RepID=UPI003AF17545
MDGSTSRRLRRVDFAVTTLFGAVYGSALFLIVAGFAVEPSGCGGRFQESCSAEISWRLGVGFGLIALVAPLLHKLVPNIPFDQGVGRAAAIAALTSGAASGTALAWAVLHTLT